VTKSQVHAVGIAEVVAIVDCQEYPVFGLQAVDFECLCEGLPLSACHVGYDDIIAQVQLGLIQDPPAARTAVAELRARYESGVQRRIAESVRARWMRTYEKFAVDKLAHLVLGQRDDVVGGRGSPSGQRRARKVARYPSSPNAEVRP
jgi:hypothetical protein